MAVSKCPSCGGSQLFRSKHSTAARGLLGPDLLPRSSPGKFRAMVCKDCGLVSLFASLLDRKSLGGPEWELVSSDGLSSRPLGLDKP
jgi:hypothetical protein